MDHDHGMLVGETATITETGLHMQHRMKMMMHVTFFWGKDVKILFIGWPGRHRLGMYILALLPVFMLALLVEWLSHCRLIKPTAGLLQTLLPAARVSLAYLVMLAVMSFNVGVFIFAIAGHTVGFLLFGSRVFHALPVGKAPPSDLPPMNC
ncbi:hypothetical protein ACLOJK_026323 [Asimina triloba]